MSSAPPVADARVAVLVDCDNTRPEILDHALRVVAQFGRTATKNLMRYVQHEGSPKQHFLPPAFDANGKQMGPWMVQFHDLQVIPIEQAKADLPRARIASLAPQFVPSLVERFGSYFSRIGTPNMSSD